MPRRIVLLLAALAIAATAVLLTRNWLAHRLDSQAVSTIADVPMVDVLVAARGLDTGERVSPDALRWTRWPANAAHGLLTSKTVRLADFDGAVVRVSMIAGEPVTTARLVQPGTRGTMAVLLAPGARAVTIGVTPASGMAGFIVPGDHIDLILTQTLPGSSDSGSGERHISHTILRDLRVLGTDQRSGGDTGSSTVDAATRSAGMASQLATNTDGPAAPATVTLEVSPKGAELVAVAGELGKLSLSLRSLAAGPAAATSGGAATRTWDFDATHLLPPRSIPVQRLALASAPQPPRTGVGTITANGVDVVRGTSSHVPGATP